MTPPDAAAAPAPARASTSPAGEALPARVAVCVPTFRRPQWLARLLEGLDALEFGRAAPPELRVVVVDNDPEGSARESCAEWSGRLRWPLVYRHEPRRGLSHVRNTAIQAAREAGAEWIAFIDDDEVPEPRWLDELLRVQAEHDADVVSGPVPGRFEGAVPEWVRRGGFFDRARRPTGSRVEHSGTGNVLLRASLFDGVESPFDPRFGLAGGEDTHLFLRLAAEGRRMVWADEAVAYETIPESRTRARWILQRGYREANTWALCEAELNPSPRTAAVRVAKALGRIGMGLCLLPLSPLRGRHAAVRALRHVWWGAGSLAGLAGVRYHEYRRTHGS